jgi:hypothetical protein
MKKALRVKRKVCMYEYLYIYTYVYVHIQGHHQQQTPVSRVTDMRVCI